MKVSLRRYRFTATFLLAFFAFSGGCSRLSSKEITPCPPKQTVEQVFSQAQAHSRGFLPLRASGRCRLHFHDEKGKEYKEDLSIKLLVYPPRRIYLQGDALIPKALILGANDEDFWVWAKPKEIDSYWWGKMDSPCLAQMLLNPNTFLESLGILTFQSAGAQSKKWTLAGQGRFDILQEYSDDGTLQKKVYLDRCDYLVRKIEYFTSGVKPAIVAELDNYTQVRKEFFVPANITIQWRGQNSKSDSAVIKLRPGSMKIPDLSQSKQDRLFTRPVPKDVANIYEIDEDCQVRRQPAIQEH
ncbi:MAG: hypothetical protein ABIG61_10185 [Planctomycetota bacterium]